MPLCSRLFQCSSESYIAIMGFSYFFSALTSRKSMGVFKCLQTLQDHFPPASVTYKYLKLEYLPTFYLKMMPHNTLLSILVSLVFAIASGRRTIETFHIRSENDEGKVLCGNTFLAEFQFLCLEIRW